MTNTGKKRLPIKKIYPDVQKVDSITDWAEEAAVSEESS
jgi:hypothetical protein